MYFFIHEILRNDLFFSIENDWLDHEKWLFVNIVQ